MRTKRFTQAALTTLLVAVAACTNSPVLVDTEFGDFDYINSGQGPAIKFAPFAQRSTKAVPTASDLEFYHNTFKVYGTKTNNEGTKIQTIFEGVTVNAVIEADTVANTWTYDTDRYWDKQADNYQFIAFAPAHAPLAYDHNLVEVNDSSAEFFSQGDYTLIGQNLQEGAPQNSEKNAGFTGEAGKDCDVMRSDAVTIIKPETTPVVTFNFRHTLAKLMVAIKANAASPYVITIDSVCVADLYSTGNYDHADGWAVKDSTALVDYIYSAPDTAISAEHKTYFVESLVMPQKMDTTQVVTLIYTITSGSYSEEFTYKATLAELFNDKATEFDAANSYTVSFNIAPEKNIITFDAGVTLWEESDSKIDLD